MFTLRQVAWTPGKKSSPRLKADFRREAFTVSASKTLPMKSASAKRASTTISTSKDAVALAVLERAGDWVRAQLAEVDGEEPGVRLERYFDMFRVIHGKGERMCPGGSFGSVFGAVSSPVQRALHRFAKMHLDWLEDVVREGVERGQFKIGDQRPCDVAIQIAAGVQGALLIGRFTSNSHVIDSVGEEFRSYLGYAASNSFYRPTRRKSSPRH